MVAVEINTNVLFMVEISMRLYGHHNNYHFICFYRLRQRKSYYFMHGSNKNNVVSGFAAVILRIIFL